MRILGMEVVCGWSLNFNTAALDFVGAYLNGDAWLQCHVKNELITSTLYSSSRLLV